MSLKAVFFDLDGTLLDTSLDLGAALNNVLRDHKRAQLPHSDIRPHVSNGATALIKLGFGDELEQSQLQALRQQLLDAYEADIAQLTVPFAGIMALLENIKAQDLCWGVVTNKPRLYTQKLLHKFEFPMAPAAVVSPDDAGVGKPDPSPLLLACEQAQCSPTQAVYVGDHLRDIQCGINAGMPTIAVGYGFTQEAEEHLSWNADYAVASADEIWPILKSI